MSEPAMYNVDQLPQWLLHPGQHGVPNLTFADPDKQFKNRQTMIAEAAYFKAENRGFAPGFEVQDWLEAEREVDVRLGIWR